MLKTVTWIGLGLSILSTVLDLSKSDSSGAGDVAELAMVSSLLGVTDGAIRPAPPQAPQNAAAR